MLYAILVPVLTLTFIGLWVIGGSFRDQSGNSNEFYSSSRIFRICAWVFGIGTPIVLAGFGIYYGPWWIVAVSPIWQFFNYWKLREWENYFRQNNLSHSSAEDSSRRTGANLAMNKVRASKILLEQLEKYKAISYEQLKDRVLRYDPDTFEVVDGDTTYDIKILFYWDSGKPGNIRVIGNISISRGWSAYLPHSEDFIVRPDGSFIE